MNSAINILGYYNANNAGDDAYGVYFKQLLGMENVKLINSFSPEAQTYNRFIFGGGAILNNYFIDLIPNNNSQIDVISTSFPNYGDTPNILLRLKERIGLLYLRSTVDNELALSVDLNSNYCPDIIFDLDIPKKIIEYREVIQLSDLPLVSEKKEKTIIFLFSDHYLENKTITLNRYLEIENFKKNVSIALDLLTSKYNIILAPLSLWYNSKDYCFGNDIVSRMKNPEKITQINSYLGPDTIINIINNIADIVVSMRYHGLIFGMICGKPVINIGDSKKNVELMIDCDLDELNHQLLYLGIESFMNIINQSSLSVEKIKNTVIKNKSLISIAKSEVKKIYNY